MHFETEICSRCHGTGEYSYCEDYGTKCFKCAGAKVTLTKRGAKAKAFYNELCTIEAKDLRLGDTIQATSIARGGRVFSYLAQVTESKIVPCQGSYSIGNVTETYTERLSIETSHAKYGTHSIITALNHRIMVYNSHAKADNLAKALTFQASLTKQGMPRKR